MILFRNFNVKTLDCKFFHHGQKFKLLTFFCCPLSGDLGITAFQHILQDPRTQNIPLILTTPGFNQPEEIWGKEIVALQALSNTPPVVKSEELQSLVHEIRSTIEEAKFTRKLGRRMRRRMKFAE